MMAGNRIETQSANLNSIVKTESCRLNCVLFLFA